MKNEKKSGFNLNFINTNRSYFFLLLILLCGLFAKNFFSAYNICAVTGNGSLVIYLGLGFTLCLIAGHMDLTVMYVSTFASLLCLGHCLALPLLAAALPSRSGVLAMPGIIIAWNVRKAAR